MSIDIKTANIEPVRLTFDHLEARIGKGKSATRYQEAVHDFQMTQNFHYRPTWEPEMELFDVRRTKISLDDFDALTDPRQYYYGPYTIQRAKQQDNADSNFALIEKRKLFATLSGEWTDKIRRLIVPLRHVEWGANTNNTYLSGYGYGAPFTSAALMHAMDRLGMAQYLTRLALAVNGQDPVILDEGKALWLDDPLWQPLRRLVEDAMVQKDWFELHVLQNLLQDSQLVPLAFVHFDEAVGATGNVAFTLGTEFMREWFNESSRWVDATIKTASSAKPENRQRLNDWVALWWPRVQEAVAPLVLTAFGAEASAVSGALKAALNLRLGKLGLEAVA